MALGLQLAIVQTNTDAERTKGVIVKGVAVEAVVANLRGPRCLEEASPDGDSGAPRPKT